MGRTFLFDNFPTVNTQTCIHQMLSKRTKSRLLSMWRFSNTQQCNMTAFDYSTPVFSLYNSSGISTNEVTFCHYREETDITWHFLLILKESAAQGLMFGRFQAYNMFWNLWQAGQMYWWYWCSGRGNWHWWSKTRVFNETPKRPAHFWWTRRTSILGLQCIWVRCVL